MPSVAAALLAMTMQRPITDAGVWLDAPPPPGTVVTAPLRLAGETQAPEGVLSVRLYAIRGASATEVASYVPVVPVGTVPFVFTWSPSSPGSYTLRVVSTTAVRGFSADVPNLVVPAKPVAKPAARPVVAPKAPRVAPRAVHRRVARRVVVTRPRLDDSGRAFGRSAPTLPYTRPAFTRSETPVRPPAAAARGSAASADHGWASVAGGLLLLLVCSHLHRSLRPQPEPRGTR